MTRPILCLGFLLLFAAPLAAQRHFHLDEPFQHPAKIPDRVLPLLRDEVKSTSCFDATLQSADVRSLFLASRIALNHHPAYILKSGHPCLTGGDNDSFWIYLKTARSYRLVLASGTIAVDVLATRSNRLHDIAANMCTGAFCREEIYKFNGSVYKALVCRESEWQTRSKFHRVPCRR